MRTPTIEVPDATYRAALAEEPDYDRETDEADLEAIGRGLQEAAEGKTIPGDVVLAALENTHTAQGDDAAERFARKVGDRFAAELTRPTG